MIGNPVSKVTKLGFSKPIDFLGLEVFWFLTILWLLMTFWPNCHHYHQLYHTQTQSVSLWLMSLSMYSSWASRWIAWQSRKRTFSCWNWHFDQEGRALIKGNGYQLSMVRLLRPQTHSRKLPFFLQIDNIWALADDLKGHRVTVYCLPGW